MIRLCGVVTAFVSLVLLWHECGEDVGVFCYRIGQGAMTTVRSRALVAISAAPKRIVRTRSACSNPSSIGFTRSMMSKD